MGTQFDRLYIGNFYKLAWKLLILAGIFHLNCISANMLCPKDSRETFLPATENCDYFVFCGKFSERILKCPPGLKFDVIRKVCDLPQKTTCQTSFQKTMFKSPVAIRHPDCPSTDPSHAVLLPHKSDCGKFYICSHELAYTKSCLKGLHFNNRLKVCDYPENAKCTEKFPDKQSKDTRVQKCSQIKFQILPHESDCQLFYICENGIPSERTCADGLHFNPEIMVCDFPERAGCKLGFQTPEYRIGITEAKETKEATGFPSLMCPKINGKYPIFFQGTEHCSVYYMCGNGLAYKFTCPSGLHFNLRKKVCDDPNRAGCLRGQTGEIKSS